MWKMKKYLIMASENKDCLEFSRAYEWAMNSKDIHIIENNENSVSLKIGDIPIPVTLSRNVFIDLVNKCR